MDSFQKSSFQLAETRLVSTPNDDSLPSAITPAQYIEAIDILKGEDDRDISAWLKLARSLERNVQPRSDHARLTRDQLRAIAGLRHCKSNDVSAWFHLARMPSAAGTLAVSASPSLQLHNWTPDQGCTAPSVLPDLRIPGPFDHSSDQALKEQVTAQNFTIRPSSTSTVPPSPAKPKYCCTLCGFFRPFKNLSDWKKHEREHDTTYVCTPKGPREATPQGSQCAFCGYLNPHDDHLFEHNAQACLQGLPGSFSSKRRHEMVNHLGKVHDIHPKSQGEAIAMKWKYTVEKQAWSCGFCGEVFVTFNDRLNHITTQHFESGHTIAGWHATNVIQGLLKQPGMVEAWKEKVASLPTWEVNDMVWESDAIIELQHDLEVGPNTARSAVDLAKAAYVACRMNRGMEYQRAMTAPESKSDKTLVATPFSPNHSQTPLASAPNFLSNHHQTRSAIQELDETSPRGLAIQVMPLKSNNYSSTPTPDLSNSNNVGSALSTFCPATRDQGNYTNSQHGGNGNDKEEDEIWPRTPGSVYETEFDTVFNIDDRRA